MARESAPEWAISTSEDELAIAEKYLQELKNHSGIDVKKFTLRVMQLARHIGMAQGTLETSDRFVADILDVPLDDQQVRGPTQKLYDRAFAVEREAEYVFVRKMMQLVTDGAMEPLKRKKKGKE